MDHHGLEKIIKELVRLAIEKRLKTLLYEVAPELPDEVLDEFYSKIFRPVMVNTMIIIRRLVG